jgi:hypothetical protein
MQGIDLNRDAGASASCCGTGGVIVLVISVGCTSANLVTLECGVSTLGSGASTLGMCVACHAAWFAQTLLHMVLTFASSFFAIAILVNSLLTFHASVVWFPVGMFPLDCNC